MSIFPGYPPELCTKQVAAFLLGVTEWEVQRLIRVNELTYVDVPGKRRMIRLSDIRARITALVPPVLAEMQPFVPRSYPPELLSRGDVCYLLNISMSQLGVLTRAGTLVAVTPGKHPRFQLADVRAYIASLSDRIPDS